jgi:hypothetical protein
VSDLRRPKERHSIRRLQHEHGIDESLCDSKVLHGLVHLAGIGGDGHALHARHAHISIADLQGQLGISVDVRRQPP